MHFFHMADFMGQHGIQLLLVKGSQQGRGEQEVAKTWNNPHDAGRQHLPLKKRPVENLRRKIL